MNDFQQKTSHRVTLQEHPAIRWTPGGALDHAYCRAQAARLRSEVLGEIARSLSARLALALKNLLFALGARRRTGPMAGRED